MGSDAPLEGVLRAASRAVLPVHLRIALRRAPAVLAHLLASAPPRAGDRSAFAHTQCTRKTPLVRAAAPYDDRLQRGKQQNVARAAALVDGAIVEPGGVFSWHAYVGPPLRARGFAPGPELHGDRLVAGVGGGACQVSNLVCWLALHSGMELVERHRHELDLFADHDRTAPFGSGATVFFPHRDLRFENPGPQPLLLELSVSDGVLWGAARLPRDPGATFELLECDARFTREGDSVFRSNRLLRRRTGADGVVSEQSVAENRARVLYPVAGV